MGGAYGARMSGGDDFELWILDFEWKREKADVERMVKNLHFGKFLNENHSVSR
jgi:hypothetical protein